MFNDLVSQTLLLHHLAVLPLGFTHLRRPHIKQKRKVVFGAKCQAWLLNGPFVSLSVTYFFENAGLEAGTLTHLGLSMRIGIISLQLPRLIKHKDTTQRFIDFIIL